MNEKEKFQLIKRNLQEIIGENELKEKLKSNNFSIYWGTMPTGSISVAYFFPMLKIADFLKAGCKIKILIADLHAALDSVPWGLIEKRYEYYKEAIILILKALEVDTKKLEFVKGSSFQLEKKYSEDLLKLSTMTSIKDSTRAASEAVKTAQGNNVKVSGLIYPLMQALDEEYLKIDAQFAGLDQRKIMVYAREFLPKIGYAQRIELMTPMIRGLVGEKMSSSIESTKIDLLDDEKKVKTKFNKAEFIEGDSNNGVMALLKYFIFPVKNDNKEKFTISRPEKFGGNISFNSYEELEKQVKEKKIHPLDVKNATASEISKMLKKVQTDKLKKLYEKAYN